METLARSISRPVAERLREGPCVARALAVFERACDLVAPDGDVIALVLPEVGDGPFNVVVGGPAGLFDRLSLGEPVALAAGRLQGGGLRVDLGRAAVWEPRPDWGALRARCDDIVSSLACLDRFCLRLASAGSWLTLLEGRRPAGGLGAFVSARLHTAAPALEAGWGGDGQRLRQAVAQLVGLGSGLTPAGDDFLCGLMLRAWLAHPAPDLFCRDVVEVAVSRTTTLSAAFLRAAARGECSARWHCLLAALREGEGARIRAAVQAILAHGATSGADILAGFLYRE